MKKFISLFLMLTFFILAGCNTNETLQCNETNEEAIENGLFDEGSNPEAELLSIEDIKGETVVFFEYNQALGVASIQENKKGFNWNRSSPFIAFESDSPYIVAGFDFESDKVKRLK